MQTIKQQIPQIIGAILVLFILYQCKQAEPPQPVQTALKTLEEHYVLDALPAYKNALFSRCAYHHIDKRHFIKCGISYGNTEFANNGVWEVLDTQIYALNGKAQVTLQHFKGDHHIMVGKGIRPGFPTIPPL